MDIVIRKVLQDGSVLVWVDGYTHLLSPGTVLVCKEVKE